MGTKIDEYIIKAKRNTAFNQTITPPDTYSLDHIHVLLADETEQDIEVPSGQALSYLLSLPLLPQKIEICVLEIISSFSNLIWQGNLALPNKNTPFVADNVGYTNTSFSSFSNSLANNDNSGQSLKLLAGNAESIFEFWYFSNSGHSAPNDGNIIAFTTGASGLGKSFGISNGNHCGNGGALQQIVSFDSTASNFGSTINAGGTNCNASLVTTSGVNFRIGYVDTAYYNAAYPKTKFKFRTINGNFELYKNDVLVGTLAYDNTVSYDLRTIQENYGSGTTNVSIQLIKVQGNFE